MQAQKEQSEASPGAGNPTPLDPLVALVAGNVRPFEDFVRGHTPLFLAFFRRLGAGPADAEDLTQEVMLRLFKSADRYQTSGRFEAFAFRVARNAWIDRRRKASVRPQAARGGGGGGDEDDFPDPLDHLTSREPSPESAAESQETQEHLFAALAQLSTDHREAFRLGVLEKVPYSDIAQHLKVPVGTVKSRVFHAVRHLRQLLGSETAPLPGSDS